MEVKLQTQKEAERLNTDHPVFIRNSINIKSFPNLLLCFREYPFVFRREAVTVEAHSQGSGLRSRTCVFHVAA